MLIDGVLRHGAVALRPLRVRDWRVLDALLRANRAWLQPWEASLPELAGPVFGQVPTKTVVRHLVAHAKQGLGVPLLVFHAGVPVGQLNVTVLGFGSLSSAAIGYWVAQEAAGKGIIPTAVALTTDALMREAGLHRVEIALVPENGPSRRVVEKLGFRFEGRREKFMHIDGGWRDHDTFALVREDVPEGLVARLPPVS